MKFLSLAFLFVSSIAALPQDRLYERQSGVVITTGATGNVLPRKEVRQLKDQNYNQWVLFILAMAQMHTTTQSSPVGFYGIANVHGVPRDNYNGVRQCSNCGGTDGYGVHNSVLFPPWHRVYIALFEQEMIKVAKSIANSYPASTRQTMVNAANQLRMPYWDWAAHPPNGKPVLPLMISDVDVTVPGPAGQKTFTNPLFRHDFQDPSGLFYSSPPFTKWKRTYRWPNNLSDNPASQTQKCAAAYANSRQSLQDQMYSLFTQCNDYLHFSNDMAGSSSTSCSTSLENVHNTVHSIAGGPDNTNAGHMTFIPISSYDPLFWLHHVNVDRFFAMWQRIHTPHYVVNQVAPTSSWTIAQGTTTGLDTPLTPFYKDNSGNFWTARQVEDWTVFKYTYPEFSNSDGSAASISRYVNNLYGPNANAPAGSSKREASPQGLIGGILNAASGLVAGNGSLFQYTANIVTPRYHFGSSYSIFVFNGAPTSETPADWYFDKNLIGPMGVAAGVGGDDSTHPMDLLISGSIPLTRTLQSMVGTKGGLLGSLEQSLVVPFLAKNLQWRVSGPSGENVDPATIPGFSVTVAASTASQPSSDDVLPVFSDFVELLDVTKGRAGGSNTTTSTS